MSITIEFERERGRNAKQAKDDRRFELKRLSSIFRTHFTRFMGSIKNNKRQVLDLYSLNLQFNRARIFFGMHYSHL